MADPAAPAPATPSAPSPAPAPAARPGSLTGVRYDQPISDQAFDRLSGSDQARFMRVRDQNNNPQWVPRSDLAPSPAPKRAAAPAPGEPPVPPAAPASVVDGKLRVGELELSADDVAALMRTRTELDLRAAAVPPTAADYKPDLHADMKLPPGIEFKIDTADPAYRDLAAFAHARGWDQEAFSTAIGIFASREARQAAAFNEAQRAEVQKLGANGTSRVTAVETWLRSTLGDELANSMRPMIVTSRIVEGFEKLASKQFPAANFSQAHRTPEPSPGPGRVSDEEYSRMTSAERWEYARSFPQSQFYPDRKNGESNR
jgi:hypothetical protein